MYVLIWSGIKCKCMVGQPNQNSVQNIHTTYVLHTRTQTHSHTETNIKNLNGLRCRIWLKAIFNRETSGILRSHYFVSVIILPSFFSNITRLIESKTPMADSEKVQDQQHQLKQKQQSIQNHSDGINGESTTPDLATQPKQIIGEYRIIATKL